MLPTAAAAFSFDAEQFGFDLRKYRIQAHLDDYSTIRCINFIRSEVAAGRDPLPALAEAAGAPGQGARPWDDDKYLQPVLAEDALLFHDFGDEDTAPGGPGDPEVAHMFREEAADAGPSRGESTPDDAQPAEPVGQPANALVVPGKGKAKLGSRSAEAERVDRSYFDSYSYFDIHREMLSDKVRTDAYRDAIERNPGLVKGRTVLDVGCGTGILSMFAARAGAAAVIGVDGSSKIAGIARLNCSANGLAAEQGGPISIVTGRIEQLDGLPVDQVDVIVSEWMGYGLLFESMLDSVLYARDRWLKPGGAILPDTATIYLAAAAEGATGLDFWRNVYGFHMDPVRQELHASSLHKAVVAGVAAADIISEAVAVKTLDLATMSVADADFSSDFVLTHKPQAGQTCSTCHAVVLWFDTAFSARFCPDLPVTLSTSPHGPQTHWAQTILCLRQPILLGQAPASGTSPSGSGSRPAGALRGRISIARSNKHRSLDISLEYAPVAADGSSVGPADTLIYSVAMSA
ncbi:hypothetical protein WJX72_003898 [[Myrmecia] bisecta]|uniref:type I protein arginine methyltransferase n=1 Tax=[Myrmecia] bisecta TaxID=41462 RepID=A0AAW1QPY4_9CHLO